MGKKNYYIKKKVTEQSGKVSHTIMTEGSEVWEFTDREEVTRIVNALNENTDNGCEYRVWQVQPLDK